LREIATQQVADAAVVVNDQNLVFVLCADHHAELACICNKPDFAWFGALNLEFFLLVHDLLQIFFPDNVVNKKINSETWDEKLQMVSAWWLVNLG